MHPLVKAAYKRANRAAPGLVEVAERLRLKTLSAYGRRTGRSLPRISIAEVVDGGTITITNVPESVIRVQLHLIRQTDSKEMVLSVDRSPAGWTVLPDLPAMRMFGNHDARVEVSLIDEHGIVTKRTATVPVSLPDDEQCLWPLRWMRTPGGRVALRRLTPVEAIRHSGLFDEDYYRSQVEGCDEVENFSEDEDPISHYVRVGARAGLDPTPLFRSDYYRTRHRYIGQHNPFAHYVSYGWRECNSPYPGFDTWWYWSKHMDPARADICPLRHYRDVGQDLGLSTQAEQNPTQHWRESLSFAQTGSVRRVCLFVGYDKDGIVDDYVVDYVRELSRFCDVHYLADGEMHGEELEKLSPYTKSARAERHGEYDFGSYKRLAEDVGWDTIAGYDELLLVNDSAYLLTSLDEVFSKMDGKSCDWWGLQATKGFWSTRKEPTNQFKTPIPVDTVVDSLADEYESERVYDFLVGSYFVAFRRPVIDDPEFRRYLGSVTKQQSKTAVVRWYEIGLTHWLIAHGHKFATLVDHVYPFQPIYSLWYLRLLEEGFPLLKRNLLVENTYRVPRLNRWQEFISERVSGVDFDPITRNLERVIAPDKLRANLEIGVAPTVATEEDVIPDRLLDGKEFVVSDRKSPKYDDWWAFPVCFCTPTFGGNERAVFEAVKDDPRIRKIVLTRDVEVSVDGVNTEVVPLASPEGQHLLMRCGTVFVDHRVVENCLNPVQGTHHNIINLWHGTPLKRIECAADSDMQNFHALESAHRHLRTSIASSESDRLAMAASFYPLTTHQVWITGLPRNDFILRDEEMLPADYREELLRLRALKQGRRLVLYMPTWRILGRGLEYAFSEEELAWLRDWLSSQNAVLGVREHFGLGRMTTYEAQFSELPMISLRNGAFNNVEMLYRESDAMITDYSSAFVDYMITSKPLISFAYDYERYKNERGTYYDLDTIFPGSVCRDFADLQKALASLFDQPLDPLYSMKRSLLVQYVDDGAGSRVAQRARDLALFGGIGKPSNERFL